jgi:hypothetical protein
VWKYINRERKEKESVNEEITMQEWEEYLMKLVEGRKEEGEARIQLNEKQMTPKETEITAEEVERQMRKLKNSKKFEAWHLRTTWSLWQRVRGKERNYSEPGKVCEKEKTGSES